MRTKAPLSKILRRLHASFSVLTGQSYYHSKAIYEHHAICFSQEGEDRLLERVMADRGSGFYVDVGAHHPQRYSNTYRFYLRGWQGINIEAMPGSARVFDSLRPRDLNLQIAISDKRETLTYFEFNEPALNTFDTRVAEDLASLLLSTTKIEAFPLAEVLAKYLPSGQHIDFLSVDVEGFDLKVLRSNDWSRFRPGFVLAESLRTGNVVAAMASPLHEFMVSQGYSLYGKLMNTLVFVDQKGES